MSIDVGMRESLIEAGLVDPASGEFTSEPNFGEKLTGDVPRDPLPNDDEAPLEPKQEAQPDPRLEQGAVVDPSPRPASNPNSGADVAADPSKLGDTADPIRQDYESHVGTLRQQAREAFLVARTLTDNEGNRLFSDDQLEQRIGQELQMAERQAYLTGVMRRMEPVAKRAAAEKIAQDHGVDVADIINEPNHIAMQARAKTIADLTRDGRFQRRKESGTDVAEGSRSYNNSVPEGLEKLSPQQKIYAGLARGDR
jgi:hypothetical protein